MLDEIKNRIKRLFWILAGVFWVMMIIDFAMGGISLLWGLAGVVLGCQIGLVVAREMIKRKEAEV